MSQVVNQAVVILKDARKCKKDRDKAMHLHASITSMLTRLRSGTRRRKYGALRADLRMARADLCKWHAFHKGPSWSVKKRLAKEARRRAAPEESGERYVPVWELMDPQDLNWDWNDSRLIDQE